MAAKVLTEAEIKRVLAVIAQRRHATRDRLIFQFTLLAGMRACEVAGLLTGDVLQADGTAMTEILLKASQTKGSKSRTVYVSKRLQKEIALYSVANRKGHVTALFVSQKTGCSFTARGVVLLLKCIYVDANAFGASSHSGRRTFLTRLAARGVSPFVMKELAGHKNMATTQRYVDIGEHQLRAALENGQSKSHKY